MAKIDGLPIKKMVKSVEFPKYTDTIKISNRQAINKNTYSFIKLVRESGHNIIAKIRKMIIYGFICERVNNLLDHCASVRFSRAHYRYKFLTI